MIQNAHNTATGFATERRTPENSHDGVRTPAVGSPLSGIQRREVPHGRNSNATDVVAKHLLSVEEVALLLNVPRKWVYRRIGLKPPNGIPHLKVGKYVRFKESDIRDYVERLRRNR